MAYIVTTETTLSDGAINNVDISMPAGHQAGDMTVLMITQDDGRTDISVPSGFTQIGTQGRAQAQRTTAMFRVHAGSGEADVNITGTNDEWLVTAVLLRGATALSVHQEDRTDSANSTSNSLTSGTVTTTVDNCIVLSCFGFDGVFKLALDNDSLNKSVNLSKEINIGAVQICQYFNQLTAGTTDTLTALSEVASEGGSALTIAIAEATPSTASMSPMVTKVYDVIARYGGLPTANTTTAAFTRHDGITWENANGTITPTTIGILGVSTIPNPTLVSFQSGLSTWGSMTGLSQQGATPDATGRWYGNGHAIPATDMSNKIFSLEFAITDTTTSRYGTQGCIVHFQDSTGEWVAFQLSRRQRMVAGALYVCFIDLENSEKYDESGDIDWTDIVRVSYMLHKRGTSTNANVLRLKNALLLEKVILVDGSEDSPVSPAVLQTVLGGEDPALGGHGAYRLATLQGKGQSLSRFSIQYGDGTRKTYVDASASSYELPLRADETISRRFWQVPDDSKSAEFRIKASADDVVKLTASVVATDTSQDFIIDSTSSPDAEYDFSGVSIVGWAVRNNISGVVINDATLKSCSVTLNGGGLYGCVVTTPTSNPAVITNDPSNIADTQFESAGTGHAIEITATGTFDFVGNTFVGYGADSSTDAMIYNNSGGLVTLVMPAGSQTLTIRNGAFASTVIDSPTVDIAVPNALENSRIQIYNVTEDEEIDNDVVGAGGYEYTVASEASHGDTIRLRLTLAGYEPIETQAIFNGASGTSFLVNQVADQVYNDLDIDGSTVTEFTADYVNDRIDIAGVSTTTKARFVAWWRYNITTEDGIRNWFRGILLEDIANFRFITSQVDVLFNNTEAYPVRFTDDSRRLYREDGGTMIFSGSGSIQLDSGKVYTSVVSTSGDPVITGDITDVPSAVWGHGTRTLTSSSGGATLSEIESSTVLAKTTDVTSARDTIQSDIAGLNDVAPNEIWEHPINGKQAQARLQGAEDNSELASFPR
jgi:hypothetical protein